MKTILHSRIIGSGKPLLILHGFLGMSDNWKTLANQFAQAELEVHLIDQRNHGKSFHSPDFNYDFLAKDITEYIKYHRLGKVTIIGHSMGGKTAMQFACDNPELTHKLIIADIAPKYYPPHHHDIIKGLTALDFNIIKSRKDADNELSNYITEPGIRQFLLKNLYWIKKGSLALRFNLEILQEKMEEIGENIDATAVYNGPALFLKGDKSEYVIASDLSEIQKHFPKAELDTIENAGHWLHAENPKQFLNKSLKFIFS